MQEAGLLISGGHSLAAPRFEREGMRDPWIARVRVVFHYHEPALWHERKADRAERWIAVADEVKAVGGQDAVEGTVRHGLGEVERPRLDTRPGECPSQPGREVSQHPRVPVAGQDLRARTEGICESERECALAGPELEPSQARAFDAAADQRDVIFVVHPRMIAG